MLRQPIGGKISLRLRFPQRMRANSVPGVFSVANNLVVGK
jgi:hypothetical protein